MNAWPEAATVERFLVRVRRRMLVLRALEGVAVGLAVAALLAIGGVRSITTLTATVLALRRSCEWCLAIGGDSVGGDRFHKSPNDWSDERRNHATWWLLHRS